MHNFKTMENMVAQLHKDMAQAQENALMEQLNEFISRGLIIVELTQPILVQSPMSTKVEIRQACRLVLKDQEYIEQLERENKTLKEQHDKIKEAASLIFEKKETQNEKPIRPSSDRLPNQ